MDWDDVRYVLAVAKAGSLAGAAKALSVDHTTVGRRVESAETSLGVTLFARTRSGYVPTADAERLLGEMRAVEDAVVALERSAHVRKSTIDGTVRVTAPETFGCAWLAPRLAMLRDEHPRLSVELAPSGMIAIDADGVILLINREVERLFGYSKDELVGKSIEVLVPIRFRSAHPGYLRRPKPTPCDFSGRSCLFSFLCWPLSATSATSGYSAPV